MAFTNPREKHPETQRAYMGLSVAHWQDTGVKTDMIPAPGAGYCINIWAVFAFSNSAAIDAWGIGDGVATPISVAATKTTSTNIALPMPVIFGDNKGIDIIDTHGAITGSEKLTTVYYTITPV